VGLKKDAIVHVVSNPVDVLTYLATIKLKLPRERVIGLGTQLDTIRFRALLSEQVKAPPTQVSAVILGEHGDSMVPIWSSATVAGLPLEKWPGWSPHLATEIFTRTKGSGAEVIKRKGGAGFAVGIAIRDVIESIALDQRRILPVSSIQSGAYDVKDVALSVPTVVGRAGILGTHEVPLWPKEMQGLKNSANALKPTVQAVMQRVGK
jgi:L-lactate dehydrogenase